MSLTDCDLRLRRDSDAADDEEEDDDDDDDDGGDNDDGEEEDEEEEDDDDEEEKDDKDSDDDEEDDDEEEVASDDDAEQRGVIDAGHDGGLWAWRGVSAKSKGRQKNLIQLLELPKTKARVRGKGKSKTRSGSVSSRACTGDGRAADNRYSYHRYRQRSGSSAATALPSGKHEQRLRRCWRDMTPDERRTWDRILSWKDDEQRLATMVGRLAGARRERAGLQGTGRMNMNSSAARNAVKAAGRAFGGSRLASTRVSK